MDKREETLEDLLNLEPKSLEEVITIENSIKKNKNNAKNNKVYVPAYNSYTQKLELIGLSRKEYTKYMITGLADIGERQYPGWKGSIRFYMFRLEKANFIDYVHGYDEKLYAIVKDRIYGSYYIKRS